MTKEELKQSVGEIYPAPKDTVIAHWFLSWNDPSRAFKQTNFMATAWVSKETGLARGSYRFCYCEDDEVFNGKDRRSWTTLGPKPGNPAGTPDELHDAINLTFETLKIQVKLACGHWTCEGYKRIDGSVQDMYDYLAKQEWASVKKVPKEDDAEG